MKYVKCPRCDLNFIKAGEEEICAVCKRELSGVRSNDDNELELCPFCFKNYITADELMCQKCAARREAATSAEKRSKKTDE
jgi:hypothetical protein